MGLPEAENVKLRELLQDAVVKCSERCLYQAAKWAAELLNSIPTAEADLTSPTDTEIGSPMVDEGVFDQAVPTGVVSRNPDVREAKLEAAELHKYLMAKTFFDCREYDRCAAVFLPMTLPKGPLNQKGAAKPDPKGKAPLRNGNHEAKPVSMQYGFPNRSEKALFLALYAKYMAGEKRRDEETESILGPRDTGAIVNRELVGIGQALEARMELIQSKKVATQGWLEYLYGVVLAKSKSDNKARQCLLRSVYLYPYNWGAWQELGLLVTNKDERISLAQSLPQNLISYIFNIHLNQQMFNGSDEVTQQLENIREVFPENSFLIAQEALIHYHNKDYDRAENCFTSIMMNDPLRLEDMDTFSNILYVMGKRAKLSYLAQLTTAIDKFRPETCCVVGNYHGMKSEHEKAVTYFRRALQLDRNFAAAWTLMGHEYVELKNSQTAIECYRRAVDVNRRDYRAWYGLGQTYELLDMHFYALYYYQRASAIAHADPKMWNAVGACLERLDRNLEAIKAYKRCLMAGSVPASSPGTSFASGTQVNMPQSMEPEVLVQIAQLYAKLGDFEEAEAYMELTIAQEGTPVPEEEADPDISFAASTTGKPGLRHDRGPTETTSKARLWLARYNKEKGSKNALKVAQAFATELCEDGYEVEEAKSLIKEIRALSGEGITRTSGRFSMGPGG